mgnify:CR=1 FL=1
MSSVNKCLLIGNSRWHWATEINGEWSFSHKDPNIYELKSNQYSLLKWAAVGELPNGINLDPKKEILIQHIPLNNIPPWIGIDRAIASWIAFKKANEEQKEKSDLLVADAGTIMSINKIKRNGEFVGGQLIAGLRLQLAAMVSGAKNLHKINQSNISEIEAFPLETSKAMQRGCIQALTGALIEAQKEAKSELWLCGGDANLLYEELKRKNLDVKCYPNLVLEGIVDLINLEMNT